MRILFFGNDYHRLSITCLDALVGTGHEICVGVYIPESAGLLSSARAAFRHRGPWAVVTKAARLAATRLGAFLRSFSGADTGLASLREIASRHGLPVIDVTRLRDPETVERVREARPDLIVVGGFSQILRSEIIRVPRIACINTHPSLLPAYRGPSPIYWVLANEETETGVTVHFIDEGIDSGDIIGQRRVPIHRGDDEHAVFDRCLEAAASLLPEVLESFERDKVERMPQDPEKASYHSHPPRGASKL